MITSRELREAVAAQARTLEEVSAAIGVSRRTFEAWMASGGCVPKAKEAAVRKALDLGEAPEREDEALVNVNIRLSAATLRRLDEAADVDERSRSQMARLLLERGLA